MKRDLDLIKKILLAMENKTCGFPKGEHQIEGFTEEQIAFPVHLLRRAGLALVADSSHAENILLSAISISITRHG